MGYKLQLTRDTKRYIIRHNGKPLHHKIGTKKPANLAGVVRIMNDHQVRTEDKFVQFSSAGFGKIMVTTPRIGALEATGLQR